MCNETNLQQAEVPDNCVVIKNKNGTAPGMWFQQEKKVFVSMPGVPYEMKTMLTEEVVPRLKKTFSFPIIIHRTIMTCGIGESFLAELIKDWEENLPSHFLRWHLPGNTQTNSVTAIFSIPVF